MKQNDPRNLAEFISCLSTLENNSSLLYSGMAEKIDMPLIKALFEEIALDSHKHSLILKGVGETIAKSETKEKECEKKIGGTWRMVDKLQKEIAKMKKISAEDLPELSDKLTFLESIMGEEYYIFVQLKTLHAMMKEINQIYNIDLGSAKNIFMNIINDEERHREILQTVRQMVTKKEEDEVSSNPMVKYQNPDAWRGPAQPFG
jgi:rubrerythrin